MANRASDIDALSKELRLILTPGQMVRYLLWIERNRHRILQCGLDQGFIPQSGRQHMLFCEDMHTLG